jgi:formate hydrogenlyase subunit 3/multisubunit Na+/H+ antiporter MnhD subunit
MNEHERETAFLRHIITFDDTDERHKLERRIEEVQREERCIKRVAWLMALLGGLGLAGLAYGALFAESFYYGNSQLFFESVCILGLASLISLAMLACFLIGCRQKLNRVREECRRLARKLLESRLSNPQPLTYFEGRAARPGGFEPASGNGKNQRPPEAE